MYRTSTTADCIAYRRTKATISTQFSQISSWQKSDNWIEILVIPYFISSKGSSIVTIKAFLLPNKKNVHMSDYTSEQKLIFCPPQNILKSEAIQDLTARQSLQNKAIRNIREFLRDYNLD